MHTVYLLQLQALMIDMPWVCDHMTAKLQRLEKVYTRVQPLITNPKY